MTWSLLGGLMPPAVDTAKENKVKSTKNSGDSGNESQEEYEALDNENQEIPANSEDSYDIIPKNLTLTEIINILNQVIKEDNCEELDEVVQNIGDYEGRSITLDNVNLKSFCEQQLNLDLRDRSDHQHIYSNILSQYKFDQEKFEYHYSVKELVLLAIAANDKLAKKYQDRLFAEGNLSLLPLLVGGQKYIEAFIEKFHGTDGVYGRLKGQAIQLVEPNKIDFFSATALRKEQNLLDTVFVECVLRDLEQVLKTSNPDPFYGVLETASLIKNEEFITIVLGAFERYINEPTKKASTEELLKKSFATLLETAISQEHISVIKYLCKRYTNSADHAIYDVYEQAFADDKVITILRQQILKNIGARGRKEIYDLILKTGLDAGNIAFIERLCKECAECVNDVINYLDHKSKNNEFDNTCESTLVALSHTGSQDIIVSVLARVQVCQSILSNKQQVFRQTIQNILRNAIKEANYEVVVLLCQHVDLKFAALQAICKEEFEETLLVVAEQLDKTSKELFPGMTCSEYQKNRDTLTNLYLIRSLLESSELINTSSKVNIQTQADTQVNKGSSNNAVSPIVNVEDTSAMVGETATSSQAVDGKNNSQLSSQKSKSAGSKQPQRNIVDNERDIIDNEGASIKEAIGNDCRGGKMGRSSKKKDVRLLASPARKKISEIISKGNNLKEEFKDILMLNNRDLVLQYAKSQEGPFKDKIVDFLTLPKNKKNGAQINGKQSTNPNNTVPLVPPTVPGPTPTTDSTSKSAPAAVSSVANKISEQEDGTQTTTRQQEPNPIPTPTPEPTPQPTPALKPTLIPSVANNKSEQVNDTQTNGKLPNNLGNGSITATQNTQKSNWPTVATWTFAVAGILAGAVAPAVYFAFSVSLLKTGIIAGVGVYCLVAAAVIYYCTPKSQVENNKVDKTFNTEKASTTVSV